MSRQYKRAYELTITTDTGESKTIKGLRVVFEITKSLLSFPNLAKIEIYNPNSNTISLLQRKFTKIVLNAGYEGNIKLLFVGDIRNVFQNKRGVDRIVTIYAGDGERDYQNAVFNKTFTENISIKSAINEVMRTFKEVTIGAIEGVPDINDRLRGQTLSGSSKEILNKFADEYGFDWSIQNNEVIITPFEDALTSSEAVLVNAATGMIGSPVITEIGVDVTTLLNPALLPNGSFVVQTISSDIQLGNLFFRNVSRTNGEGAYKIQEAIFKGDSHDGEWTSTAKGRLLSG